MAAFLAGCGADEDQGGRVLAGDPIADVEALQLALELEEGQESFYRAALERDVVDDEAAHDLLAHVHEQERSHAEALRVALRQLGKRPAPPREAAVERLLEGPPAGALDAARKLEELAEATYLALVGKVRSEELLATLLAIHSVEARQAAAVSKAAGGDPLAGPAIPKVAALADLRRRRNRHLAGRG